MRILRWRLKLAEYDYDVVYKTGKINVNADALSRNPMNFENVNCKAIIDMRILNPNEAKNAEIISKMLEEPDEEEEIEEDENFELYFSDDEQTENLLSDDNLFRDNTDSIPFTQEELDELLVQQTKKALIHDPPRARRVLTRSQTINERNKRLKSTQSQRRNKPKEIEDQTNKSDKEKESDENTDDEEGSEITNEENEELNNINKLKPTIIDHKLMKNNVVDSRELLFFRKDNVAYFVDVDGNPLDSGAQKLLERNELPTLNELALCRPQVVKRKNYFHMAFPIDEGLREGPTMILNYITQTLMELRKITEELKLETISIAKTDFICNVEQY
ncbi:hypothetical protein P5V15_004340 [Pogonomyrmex californicus]